jgi:hypothetical protein
MVVASLGHGSRTFEMPWAKLLAQLVVSTSEQYYLPPNLYAEHGE